jgi:Flp pilus assembly protein TadD
VSSVPDAENQLADGAHVVRAYLETGNYERARELLRGLLSQHPSSPDLLKLDAHTEYMLENYPRTEQSAQAALAIDPSDEWAMRLYALALDGLGHQDEALWMAWRTVIAHPNLPVTHWLYARLLYGTRKFSAALVVVQEALRLKPEYVEALALRGAILKGLGRIEESSESYRQALVLDPDDAIVLHNLALNRLRRGRFSAALQGLLGAAGLDPKLGDLARGNIGVVLAKMLSRAAILCAALGVAILVVGVAASDGAATAQPRVVAGLITAALIVALTWTARAVPRRVVKSVLRKRPSIVIRLVHALLAAGVGLWITVLGGAAWSIPAGLGLGVFSLYFIKVDP